jgi:cytochrome c oxidase assembly protein subunit 15
MNAASPVSPWPGRWAALLAATTFPLVWWGGFVTATGSGMAFREWLMPDGHFMLTYPWLSSTGDKFIEHGHRLLATLAGLLTIGLVAVLQRCERRGWVRRFGWLLLAAVIGQGALGALRVVLDQRTLALVHGCTGPAFFALCVAMAVATSRFWREAAPRRTDPGARKTVRLAALCTAFAYSQLVFGAFVRHGRLLVSDSAAALFQVAVYFHVAMALLVVGHLLLLANRAVRHRIERRLCLGLLGLAGAQFLLGVGSWLVLYGQPAWAAEWFGPWAYVNREAGLLRAGLVTAHGAIGSLIVALALAATLRTARQTVAPLPLWLRTPDWAWREASA